MALTTGLREKMELLGPPCVEGYQCFRGAPNTTVDTRHDPKYLKPAKYGIITT